MDPQNPHQGHIISKPMAVWSNIFWSNGEAVSGPLFVLLTAHNEAAKVTPDGSHLVRCVVIA